MNLSRTLRCRPQVEHLEDRSLMTSGLTATLSAEGILTVTGTDGHDRIAVVQNAETNKIMVRDNTLPGTDGLATREAGELVRITLANGNQANSVNVGAVNKVVVQAGDGDDQINLNYIDTWTAPSGKSYVLKTAAEVYGGAGNDTILGGQGDSDFFGGDGQDTLIGANGAHVRNVLYGGANKDTLVGGDGYNILNKLFGEDGNDHLTAGKGDNYLYGGAGNDTLRGGFGYNALHGGDGLDLFKGGTGTNRYYDSFDAAYHGPVDYTTIQQGLGTEPNQFLSALIAIAKNTPEHLSTIQTLVDGQGNISYVVPLYWNGAVENITVKFNGSWTDDDPMPSLNAAGRVLGESWVLIYWKAYTKQQAQHYPNLTDVEMQGHYSVTDTMNSLLGSTVTRSGAGVTAAKLLLDFNTRHDVVIRTKGIVDGDGVSAGLANQTYYAVLGIEKVTTTTANGTVVEKFMVHLRRVGSGQREVVMELGDLVKNTASYFAAQM